VAAAGVDVAYCVDLTIDCWGVSRLASADDRPAPDGPISVEHVRKEASASVRWSAAAVIGRQFPQMVAALVLARVLGPETYGVISAATVYVTFTTLLLDQGLASALVQLPNPSRRLAGAVATVNILAAIVLGALTAGLSPQVAGFFRSPALAPLLAVLGAGLLLKGLAITPRAMLQRQLRFRAIGQADIAGGTIGAIAGITAALTGSGIWSMAWMVLITDAVIAAMMLLAGRGASAPNLHLGELRDILPFSLRVFGSNALAFLSRNTDNILIGRFLGVGSLSLYSMSYRVLVVPVQMIGQTVNRVVFPMFARLQDRVDLVAKGLLRAMDVLALAAIAPMVLVSVAAPELLGLVLGPAWAPAAPILTVLAIAGAKETVFYVTGPLMRARGAGKLIIRYEVLATVVQVGAIVIGLAGGVLGVAWGWTIAGFVLMPVQLLIQRRMCGVRLGEQLGRILPHAHASAWGAAAYLAVRLAGAGQLWTLLGGSLAYLLVVMAVLRFVHRKAMTRSLAAAADIFRVGPGRHSAGKVPE
jgi:O-antigen/teichoic acid export membrane protein